MVPPRRGAHVCATVSLGTRAQVGPWASYFQIVPGHRLQCHPSVCPELHQNGFTGWPEIFLSGPGGLSPRVRGTGLPWDRPGRRAGSPSVGVTHPGSPCPRGA